MKNKTFDRKTLKSSTCTQLISSNDNSPTKGRPNNLARSLISSWSGVFCVAGKNVNFYAKKSNQVAASGRFRHDHAGRTSPLSGINQMLVSASGGEGT